MAGARSRGHPLRFVVMCGDRSARVDHRAFLRARMLQAARTTEDTTMPYTIALRGDRDPDKVRRLILAALEASPFTATLTVASGPTRAYTGSLIVKPVRLRTAKLYCGQHPGSCIAEPKRRSRCLEWDDWVAFHAVVNDVLDAHGVDADAWTCPMEKMDHGRKMWIRRGLSRRVAFDWHDDPNDRHGGIFRNPIRIWNHGSADQFEVTP